MFQIFLILLKKCLKISIFDILHWYRTFCRVFSAYIFRKAVNSFLKLTNENVTTKLLKTPELYRKVDFHSIERKHKIWKRCQGYVFCSFRNGTCFFKNHYDRRNVQKLFFCTIVAQNEQFWMSLAGISSSRWWSLISSRFSSFYWGKQQKYVEKVFLRW